jgi:hypothetical protein
MNKLNPTSSAFQRRSASFSTSKLFLSRSFLHSLKVCIADITQQHGNCSPFTPLNNNETKHTARAGGIHQVAAQLSAKNNNIPIQRP